MPEVADVSAQLPLALMPLPDSAALQIAEPSPTVTLPVMSAVPLLRVTVTATV